MSDWQPGDLALCVVPGERSRPGQVFTVYAVNPWGLRLEELREHYWHNGIWSTVERFRRIAPHTPDAEDIETIRLLNGKSVPVEA